MQLFGPLSCQIKPAWEQILFPFTCTIAYSKYVACLFPLTSLPFPTAIMQELCAVRKIFFLKIQVELDS